MMRWVLALGLAIALAPAAQASEGRIPIFKPTDLNGTTASISGKYILVANLEAEAGADYVIRIQGTGSERIEIDLNGFRLTANPFGGRAIVASNLDTLTISGGSLVAPSSTMPQNNVIVASDTNSAVFEDLQISGGHKGMFLLRVLDFVVRRNTINGGASSGIFNNTDTGSNNSQGLIQDNLITNMGGEGIFTVNSRTMAVKDNRIRNAFEDGIRVGVVSDGLVVVEGNSVRRAGKHGVRVTNALGCRVSKNVVNSAGSEDFPENDGIHLDDVKGCLVFGNVVSSSDGNGIALLGSDLSQLELNVTTENQQAGLFFDATSTDNTYGKNTIRGNGVSQTLPGVCQAPGCGTAADFCDDGSGNASFGDNIITTVPPC